jgi:hypothetical protein
VKYFKIKVDYTIYSVQQNEKGYSVSEDDTDILQLKATADKNLHFHWESDEGEKSHLINKIGLAIELHNIASYV